MREYKKGMRPPREFINEKARIIGENIRMSRKRKKLTASDLGKFLNISTAYVGLIERGERCPSLETFLQICNFFGKSAEEMLTCSSKLEIDTSNPNHEYAEMITSMLDSFDDDQLTHVNEMIKSFQVYAKAARENQ